MTGSSSHASAPAERLSAVLVPLVGGAALRSSVEALSRQGVRDIVIVDGDIDHIEGATRIRSGQGATVPERRLLGFRTATNDFVAFIEDTCVAEPGWAAAMSAAFADPDVAVVGGPIHIANNLPPRARALAVCEYAPFSATGGRTAGKFAGANFALRRAAYANAGAPEDFVDNVLLDAIRRAGGKVAFSPHAGVTYVAAPPSQTLLSARYHHGRIYGGMFSARRAPAARAAAALVALGAPLALMSRSLSFAAPTLAASPQTLMWTFLMHCSWSCGEVIGKLTGSTGASLEKWA